MSRDGLGKSYGGAKRKPEDEGFGTESALTLSEIKYARTYGGRKRERVEWSGVEEVCDYNRQTARLRHETTKYMI